ncbi:DnaJ domain-containing protein [Luteitalea sp.]|uniref:DnaJ domain-containing protein n=1 Tax=Luteitalea sp. TaxID=2004800 RepID=UPI0037C5555A
MTDQDVKDYYELLQISPNADPDTVTRVFRLLAQRYHPDHPETGNEGRFREILEAYGVLNDPVQRAQYDVLYGLQRRDRWRLVAEGAQVAGDFAAERQIRFFTLEILYSRRRLEPHRPGLLLPDIADLLGCPVEHLEFTVWYLVQKGLAAKSDQAMFSITAGGVDVLEEQRLFQVRNPMRQLSEGSERRTGQERRHTPRV